MLGWLHWYRYYALPAGQDKQDYDAAAELFTQCFVAAWAASAGRMKPAAPPRAANGRSARA